MPGCDTGRNVQKYRGGGGGASTLQEALENGNISTLAIELQSSGLFIGDGGGLSNIAGVGGSVGNMQQVTTSGASTSNKIILTNTNESLQASGNVTVNSGKFFLGDGGLLSNTAGTVTLQQASNQGNVINNTISFTNAAESIVTTGKIVVGTSLEATNVNGNGSGLSSLNASNVSTGTLSISQGGTGATTLNNLIEMGTHTSGDFVGTITGGNGISSSAGTSGEDTNHALSIDLKSQGGLEFDSGQLGVDVKSTGGLELDNGELALDIKANHGLAIETNELKIDLKSQGGLEFNSGQLGVDVKANHGLAIDTNELKIDLKSGGGLEFDSNDSYKMRVKLDDANTSGKLPVNKGGTANDTFTGGGVLYYDSSNTKFVSTGSGQNGEVLKIISGVPNWGSDNVSGSSGVGSLSQVTAVGSTTAMKISITNTNVSLETTGNVVVGNNKFFKGDAGLLTNVATSSTTITSTSSEGDIMFTTASNTLNKDSNQRIKYNPSTSTLTIKDSQSGSNTLTSTTWSGQASKVIVGTDNGGTARSLAFVDGNSILKDGNDNLAWTPSSKSLRLGPSGGTSNTLTNVLWTGKSSKIAIGNTDTSGDARPVLFGIGETANKDTSDRLNWTPGGTYAGTLTIGTIGSGGTHSNITATTFTGTATKVTVNNNNIDTNTNTLAIPYVNGVDLDSKADTFHYQPSTNTVSAAIFSGTATKVTVTNESNPSGDGNARAIPYLNGTILKSVAGTLKYKPDDGTLSATTFNGALTGTAAKVTVTNESNPNSDGNARAIPYLNGTDLKSVAGTLKYKPSDGTLSAAKFSGNGSGLSSLSPSALSGAIGSALGGTGQTGYNAGDILYANDGSPPVLVKLAKDAGNFLKSTSTGVAWSPVSASTVPVTTETSENIAHGLVFVSTDDASSQALEKDMATLKYVPDTGTLSTGNLITSDTSTNARNGIANDNPTSTLSVGTVVSIQETSTGDVLIVRGNGYFNDDVYIAKKLTLPSGSVLVADTIKVRSHNVKETLVVAERPASQVSV